MLHKIAFLTKIHIISHHIIYHIISYPDCCSIPCTRLLNQVLYTTVCYTYEFHWSRRGSPLGRNNWGETWGKRSSDRQTDVDLLCHACRPEPPVNTQSGSTVSTETSLYVLQQPTGHNIYSTSACMSKLLTSPGNEINREVYRPLLQCLLLFQQHHNNQLEICFS